MGRIIMKVLVTGGAGFIGSYVCDSLLARKHEVVCVDNLTKGRLENIRHNLENNQFKFIKADIRDKEMLFKVGKDVGAIVHLAASKIPRYSGALETLTVNSIGAMNILELARVNNAKAIIASTSDVYGKSTALPFKESGDLVLGSSIVRRWSYAVSKLFDEHLAYAYKDEFGIRVTVLRYFGCYGPRSYINWWGGPQGLFVDGALCDKEIEIHGDGRQTRTFTYIEDTAEATMRALETPDADGEIINIGSTLEISILDLARLIYRLAEVNREPKIRYVPYESFSKGYEDVRRRVPDILKMDKILKFKPSVSLEEGLKRTIVWQRALTNELHKSYSLET